MTALDPFFITLAMIIMLIGFARRRNVWRQGQPEHRPGSIFNVIRYLLGHQPLLKNRWKGVAHMMVFWGVAFPLGVAVAAQFDWTLPPLGSHLVSLAADVLGIFLLLGVSGFLMGRLGARGERLTPELGWPAGLLLFIVVTGFLAEGFRLAVTPAPAAWHAPVGGWLAWAFTLPPSPLGMQVMIRLHFWAVLILIASAPFTFMRHVYAATLNVYYNTGGVRGRLRDLDLDAIPENGGPLAGFTWKQLLDLDACVGCGRCERACPAHLAESPLSPRQLMGGLLDQTASGNFIAGSSGPVSGGNGNGAVSTGALWACTTCMACVAQCPVFAQPMDKIMGLRRHAVLSHGDLPVEARPMLRNLELFKDVYGKGPANRREWTLGHNVPIAGGSSTEYLLWVGCAGGFHPQYQRATRAFTAILENASVDFAILGAREYCCGDPARRLGAEDLFLRLARRNIHRLSSLGDPTIVTLCPHCLNVLKNEYPAFGHGFTVIHASQLLARLIREERIHLRYPLAGKAVIHDPCYLGRVNDIYTPLREVCRAIPGMDLTELPRHGENGFCCGGGGGRMWLHEGGGRHINHLRAEEVSATGAGYLATACPYCLTMMADGLDAMETENAPEVMDIVEMVASAMAVSD